MGGRCHFLVRPRREVPGSIPTSRTTLPGSRPLRWPRERLRGIELRPPRLVEQDDATVGEPRWRSPEVPPGIDAGLLRGDGDLKGSVVPDRVVAQPDLVRTLIGCNLEIRAGVADGDA